MKNIYFNNFMKYKKLAEDFTGDGYAGLISEIKKQLIPKQDSGEEKEAIVIFGFSGNGKSIWIKNYCEKNTDTFVLSMDSVVKELFTYVGKQVSTMEILKAFSDRIDEVCGSGKKVIIDGNFLNLLTRSALTDSLHTYGYDVTLIDLTAIFDITIKNRIMDEASRVLGMKITEENLEQYQHHPTFVAIEKHVMNYHQEERRSSEYDEQILLDAISIGVENVITVNYEPKHESIATKKN